MSGDCKYFKEEVKTTTKRTPGITYPDGGGIKIVTYHWCEHPNSPCDYDDTRLVGGSNRLKCGGDLTKCPIEYDGS